MNEHADPIERGYAVSNKARARLEILNELLSFPTIRSKEWKTPFAGNDAVMVGDLVSIQCAPVSVFYLSWLHEISRNDFGTEYLLESIETGEFCWWSNIGVSFYDRTLVYARPDWRWSDKQFQFASRWYKVCEKNDAFTVRPTKPVFGENGSVTLDARIRYGLSDFRNPVEFKDWKKVTKKMMDEYYKTTCQLYEATKPPLKEAR